MERIMYTNNFSNKDYNISLLPDRLHYISLSRNLPKYTWNKFRKVHIEAKNGDCELCGVHMDSYHNCHEIFEITNNTVKLIDIKVLCHKCHMTQHFGFVALGKAGISIEELEEHYEKISGKEFEVESEKAKKLYKEVNSLLKDRELNFIIDDGLLGRSIIEKYVDSINELI